MNRVLLIGPLPEPTTGVSLANKVVDDGLEVNGFKVETINTSYNKFEESLGKFSLSKALFFLKLNFQAYKIFKVNTVYITPGQTFFGIMKYAIFILLTKMFGKELIIHVHGNYLVKEYAQLKGVKKAIFSWLLGKTSKGIVLSESLKGNMLPFIDNKQIFVLYNFVEDYLFSQKETEKETIEKPKIIFLSNLMQEKGILDLLEAFLILENEGFQYEARIAGNIDVKNKDVIEQYFNKLKNVEYCGVVSGIDKKSLLDWGNIFILPTYYEMEGQPISILEAMATRNLILVTNHAGIPDIFENGKNGYYIEKKNPLDIVEKIKMVSNELIVADKIRNENYEVAKRNYQVRNFISNLTRIIKV
ncbi:glycosyltransferase family 4 protein [Aestuariibaculum marinum]|uniref:Glycosyltransferase family 4 protein n=1 Tax=Aestuariibaculum marinum TaxID=2683592 RepID=A0A8J6U502_9FLAO|nr:glycosyltransferase family 4 protein [Aestuariibaculum marinum]MBD0823364.1 glycosyltransferase family 4 protein [Aestuariibaculum marinum]